VKTYRAAIVGCGKPWKSEGATGSGISHSHARGYRMQPRTELVALADIVRENAEAFQREHGGDAIFTNFREMLAEVKPDIVSICTWPHLHEEMVQACAEARIPAVHCEKPMAPSWAAAKRMVAVCQDSGTQLTFNHQRRFDRAYVLARDIIRSGRIGELRVLDLPTHNLFDWGTHWFDMAHFLNEDQPVEWILSQVDPEGGHKVFGVQHEGLGVTHFKFKNGVRAIMPTAPDHGWGLQLRVHGSEGTIEIGSTSWDSLRVRDMQSTGWEDIDTSVPEGQLDGFALAFGNIAHCLDTGDEPELSARKALRATELIFSAYYSAQHGGKVTLPLIVEDQGIYSRIA
jgi:predicted dehydrogenase